MQWCYLFIYIDLLYIYDKDVDHEKFALSEAIWFWSTLFSKENIEL